MDKSVLKLRTKAFAIQILKLVERLPNTIAARAISQQIIRSAMSVGANYRAACRGRSTAEFLAKLGIVLEEADECGYWLEIISEMKMIDEEILLPIQDECNQLTAIMFSAMRSLKNKNPKS